MHLNTTNVERLNLMEETIKNTEKHMSAALKNFENELKTLKAGRVSPSLLDKILVDYYGVPTKISQMAAVSVSESRILVIQPWDISSLKSIEKALQSSDIGVNPQNDGKVVRLIFPKITEEQRKNISKEISKIAENYKVQIRNIRRDALDKLKKMKKESTVTEDEQKIGEKKVQKLTDNFCKKIEDVLENKVKEVMTV